LSRPSSSSPLSCVKKALKTNLIAATTWGQVQGEVRPSQR
jgi:hypothetical protein